MTDRPDGTDRPTAVDRSGTVALVTGASRGAGRGIAAELGATGATVYVTGRSVAGATTREDLGGTVGETAALVTDRGGEGVPVRCDHTDDGQVRALLDRIADERGRLDVLVNNVWGGYEDHDETFDAPFWEQPLARFDRMLDAGVRAHYVASRHAVPLLESGGLVVNTTAWDRDRYLGSVPYDTAKAAVNRMAHGMARDLHGRGVAVVALAPGFMRTEAVLAADLPEAELARTESTAYVGRAVVALSGDPDVMAKTGRTLRVGDLAREYGFTDADGSQPEPFELPDDGFPGDGGSTDDDGSADDGSTTDDR